MKLLYTNGDSWTHGDEIPLNRHVGNEYNLPGITSRYYGTWPWYLSQLLDIPVCVNDGTGAGSNNRIFRKTTEFISQWLRKGKNPADLMIVIGWSMSERTEFATHGTYYRITPRGQYGPMISKDITELIETYATYGYILHDDTLANRRQVSYMITLRQLCSGLGIAYYDFAALGTAPPELREIAYSNYDNLLPNLLGGLSTWHIYVADNKQPTHEFGHPTVGTHKHWAEVLAKEIR